MNPLKFVSILLLLLISMAAIGQDTTYELRKVMSANPDRSDYSYWEFPNKAFKNDTVFYGESVQFGVYVDVNKHEPFTPMLAFQVEYRASEDSVLFEYEFERSLTTVAIPDSPDQIILGEDDNDGQITFGEILPNGQGVFNWMANGTPYSFPITARGLLGYIYFTPRTPGSWVVIRSARIKLTVGFMMGGIYNMFPN